MLAFIRRYVAIGIAAILATSSSARADLINIAELAAVNLTAGTQSSTQIISIYDTNPGTSADIITWGLGLRVVRLSGTGTVSINVPSVAYGPNHILSAPFANTGLPPNTDAPNPGDVVISALQSDFIGVSVPTSPGIKNLAGFKLDASSDAAGVFSLQLFDTGAYQQTYWGNSNGDPFNFLVNGAAFNAAGTEIGEINVDYAAVPEPGSLLLTGGLVACAAWRARRKRKAAAAPISSSDAVSA